MYYVQKAFKKIDIFPIPILLHLEHKTSYSTKLSGFLSLCALGMLTFGFIVYLKEVILKDHPNMFSITSQDVNASPMDLQVDGNILAIGMLNKETNQNFIDETVFSIEAWTITVEQNRKTAATSTRKMQKIEFQRCGLIKNNQLKHIDWLSAEELENLYCIKNDSVFIMGAEGGDQIKYLEYIVQYCNNETSGNKCKSKEEMQAIMKNTRIFLQFSDRDINFKYHEDPFSDTIRQYTSDFIDFAVKEINISYRQMTVKSDSGIIFPFIWYLTNYKVQDQLEYTNQKNDPDELLQVNFKCDQFHDEYIRTYKTLITVIHDMGGFHMLSTTVFKLICSHFGKIYLYIEIIKHAFRPSQQINEEQQLIRKTLKQRGTDYKTSLIEKKKSRNDQQNMQQIVNNGGVNYDDRPPSARALKPDANESSVRPQRPSIKVDHYDPNKIEDIVDDLGPITPNKDRSNNMEQLVHQSRRFSRSPNKKTTITGLESVISKEKDNFDLSIKEFFGYLFSSCTQVKPQQICMIEKYLEKIQGNLDVTYILNKISELDQLKTLLLSEQQLMLFNYISQPQVDEFQNMNQPNTHDPLSPHAPEISNSNIYGENYQSQINMIQGNLPPQQVAKMALEAAMEMFEKNFKDLTEIDKRILQSLHPQVRYIFEEKFQNMKDLQMSMMEKSMAIGSRKVMNLSNMNIQIGRLNESQQYQKPSHSQGNERSKEESEDQEPSHNKSQEKDDILPQKLDQIFQTEQRKQDVAGGGTEKSNLSQKYVETSFKNPMLFKNDSQNRPSFNEFPRQISNVNVEMDCNVEDDPDVFGEKNYKNVKSLSFFPLADSQSQGKKNKDTKQ